jgi:enamine deaminase RidA (YjgF/YER057c/UK114 family)
MTKRDAIFPAGRQALYEINRYSAAIRSGDLLFVSGQVGSREDGRPNLHSKSRSSLPSIISRQC